MMWTRTITKVDPAWGLTWEDLAKRKESLT